MTTDTNQALAEHQAAVLRQFDTQVLFALVFFSGFANLAMEIIGPRMFASLMGTTTIIWAVMISVTLVGLSVGYALGGRIRAEGARKLLPRLLVGNALYLLLVSWVVWEVPADAVASGVRVDTSVIIITAVAAFFVPSTLFGMTSPIAITLLKETRPIEAFGEIVGNVYAISTIGSVAGAISAAFFWIPWVGLSLSLQLFAVGLVLFAAYFWVEAKQRPYLAGVIVICLLFPQPGWRWDDSDGMELLAQREGYTQTIRVYGDDTYRVMNLGPTYQSRVNMETLEPDFSYADSMLAIIEARYADLTGREVLIIGAAGHGLAHAMENRGASVTEVEIDPFVAELSDEYFGEIQGETIIGDGRVYMELVAENSFDLILIDAFDGAANVPPHLVTREFFQAVERALKPQGLMAYNFIGTPQGDRSRSFKAVAATLLNVFDHSGANDITGDTSQNIIFAASPAALDDLSLVALPDDGTVLTDDRNPMEIFTAEARDFFYFRR